MNIPGVSTLAPGMQAAVATAFSVAGGDEFAGKLQVGQIIKGRVLRHYEGGRYAVDFNGHEKVVDSAVPLKTNEVLYGKVIGLGDRVELERVRNHSQPPAATPDEAPASKLWRGADTVEARIAGLFAQHQLPLPAEQAEPIATIVRSAANERLMSQAVLYLAKLGIPIAPEWARAVYEMLRTDPKQGLFALSEKAVQLQTSDSGTATPHDFASESPVAELAELLKQLVEERPEQAGFSEPTALPQQTAADLDHGSETNDDRDDAPDPRKWLMNVQTGGVVSHRVNTVPLLVNGRLLELNIAVFEQTDATPEQQATRHRQLSYSLKTESLGQVDAQLVLTGEHLKMRLGSDRESAADALSACAPDLLQQLKDDGWTVDAAHYEVAAAEPGGVARAVLEHVVSQDSMSRLM